MYGHRLTFQLKRVTRHSRRKITVYKLILLFQSKLPEPLNIFFFKAQSMIMTMTMTMTVSVNPEIHIFHNKLIIYN